MGATRVSKRAVGPVCVIVCIHFSRAREKNRIYVSRDGFPPVRRFSSRIETMFS